MKLRRREKVICLREEKQYPLLKKGQIYIISKIDRDHTGQYIYCLVSDDTSFTYVGWLEQYVNRYDEYYDLDNDIEAIKDIKNNCYFMSIAEFREDKLNELGI